MKFRRIKMHNFMRYKGENELVFSCDREKNVTVILGDNTFGKTTIAQAFRWGLFGEVISTNYGNKKDVVLLNNEIISGMDVGTYGTVRVEIAIEDGDTVYEFFRSQQFRKKTNNPNDLTVIPVGNKTNLSMRIFENGKWSDTINNDGGNSREYPQGCVQDSINNMFPPQLSNYFFFDGERWNNLKNKTEDIKNSINTILGLTSLIKMREHLTEGSTGFRNTVERQLMNSVKGSSSEMHELQTRIRTYEARIENYETELKKASETIAESEKIIADCDSQLDAYRNVEEYQKREKEIEDEIGREEKLRDNLYAEIVKKFSGCDLLLAAGLADDVQAVFDKVDLEGRDIPGVTQETIDFLINLGTCICGEPLTPEHEGYKKIMLLREEVYPKKIGGPAKTLRQRLESWDERTESLLDEIKSAARNLEIVDMNLENLEMELSRVREKIDRRVNLSSVRNAKVRASNEKKQAEKSILDYEHKIENTKYEISRMNEQVRVLTEQDKENEFIYLCRDCATKLSDVALQLFNKNQKPMLSELNSIISENFEKMFNAKDKYAKLEDDYRIHMYYRNVGGFGDYEEETLSNGEMIAVNFVFIVSVLELAKRRKAEQDSSFVLSLPLVLDAPFSNLSADNTGLVANRLPEFAEQVVIFMLDKDWNASGLDRYTKPEFCYKVNKEADSNSSSINRKEG